MKAFKVTIALALTITIFSGICCGIGYLFDLALQVVLLAVK